MTDFLTAFFEGKGNLGVPEALAAGNFVKEKDFWQLTRIVGGGVRVSDIPDRHTAVRMAKTVVDRCPEIGYVTIDLGAGGHERWNVCFIPSPQSEITDGVIAQLFVQPLPGRLEKLLEADRPSKNVVLRQRIQLALRQVGLFGRRVIVLAKPTSIGVLAGDSDDAKLAHVTLLSVLQEFDVSIRAELGPGNGYAVLFTNR